MPNIWTKLRDVTAADITSQSISKKKFNNKNKFSATQESVCKKQNYREKKTMLCYVIRMIWNVE